MNSPIFRQYDNYDNCHRYMSDNLNVKLITDNEQFS